MSTAERLLVYKMKVEVELERNLKVMKELLSEEAGYSLHDAFKEVDTSNSGFITRNELEAVLKNNNVYLTNGEVSALLLKFDKNRDGKVSYLEFLEELLPLSTIQERIHQRVVHETITENSKFPQTQAPKPAGIAPKRNMPQNLIKQVQWTQTPSRSSSQVARLVN